MFRKLFILFLIFIQVNLYSQTDSIWNIMILKKGENPEIKDNMINYSPTGFYLYRNCFYDIKLKDKSKHTLRLVDIKSDTLVFIGISKKVDTDLSITSKDTMWINFKSIDKIILYKSSEVAKRIKCSKHHFLFYKSNISNTLESKYAYVFPSRDQKNELVPRLGKDGILYFFEYAGELLYHSGLTNLTPKYENEDKEKALKAVLFTLDLIVNKQINVRIQRK